MKTHGPCASWLSTATSFFPSKKRCCEACCEREVKVGRKEEKKTVTEYYHRGVVAHLIGFDLPIILDIEMIRPGEGEIIAAKRLLERSLERYARFFDAVLGDALYWESPLLELCAKHGKHLLAVLKDNNPALLADAEALLEGPPILEREEKGRSVKYWDEEGFTTDAIGEPFRVIRTQETWIHRERVAGQWIETPRRSAWFWAATIPQHTMPARQLSQAGRQRWRIENTIFNTLGQHWGLDHCFHHDPTAILNFTLILFIAHTLVACFHQLNMKEPLRKRFTLIAVTAQILHGIDTATRKEIVANRSRGSPSAKA